MARKIVRVAAIAATVLFLVPVTARAATIELNFFDDPEFGNGLTADFGAYKFVLTFEELADGANFIVEITDVLTSQGTLLEGERLGNFPNHTCVPIAGDSTCVEFVVDAPDPGADTWTGFYLLQIIWFADTDGDFSNEPGNRIRVLHNRGDTEGDFFDTDITFINDNFFYFGGEPGENDPWIFGRDNNFQSFIVTQASPVPEPATLMLLGSGLTALVYHRRRRSQRRNKTARA